MKKDKREISIVRSSAAEYLTFITATGKSDVNAVYCDENVWLSPKMMVLLYNVETHTINYHLKKYQVIQDQLYQSDFDKILLGADSHTKELPEAKDGGE